MISIFQSPNHPLNLLGVQQAKFELDRDQAVNVRGIRKAVSFVVTSYSRELGIVGVTSPHLLGGLLCESFSSLVMDKSAM
jgi:hypothetical protein